MICSVTLWGNKSSTGFLMPEKLWNSLPKSTEVATLENISKKALKASLTSVVDKPQTPPSGDKHDYLSIAPYFWPDPYKPGGIPWIRKDGQINPDYYTYDRKRMAAMSDNATKLIIGFQTTGKQRYAEHAGTIIRHWFINPASRMNPNLNYAQFIPGRCEGRGIGIIDTASLIFFVDAVYHLPFNKNWTPDDLAALRKWFSDYLDWLLTSPNGIKECHQHNNHGSWYDAQIVAYAVFCGRSEIAKRQIDQYTRKRVPKHIAKDGSQPHELARTLSLNYSCYNLLALMVVANFAKRLNVNFKDCELRIRKAHEYLKPYFVKPETWKYKQIKPWSRKSIMRIDALSDENASGWQYFIFNDTSH